MQLSAMQYRQLWCQARFVTVVPLLPGNPFHCIDGHSWQPIPLPAHWCGCTLEVQWWGLSKDSPIGQRLHKGKLNLPRAAMLQGPDKVCPHVFVGDEAFQLRQDFTRPLPGNRIAPEEVIFNYRLSRARSVPHEQLCPFVQFNCEFYYVCTITLCINENREHIFT